MSRFQKVQVHLLAPIDIINISIGPDIRHSFDRCVIHRTISVIGTVIAKLSFTGYMNYDVQVITKWIMTLLIVVRSGLRPRLARKGATAEIFAHIATNTVISHQNVILLKESF